MYTWHCSFLRLIIISGILGLLIGGSTSGVSRISFRGGFKIFLEKLLGGFGGMPPPEKIFKNGAIWCVLESILLKFCQKGN